MSKNRKAVALKYKMFTDNAPIVVAKGRGFIAEKIIDIAKANKIPIREDDDLVSVLSKVDLMGEVPPELYSIIAEILVYIYRVNNKLKYQE
jgi:flagellar biosynthesis protein